MCELRYFAFKKEESKKQCNRCGLYYTEDGDDNFCQECCDYFKGCCDENQDE